MAPPVMKPLLAGDTDLFLTFVDVDVDFTEVLDERLNRRWIDFCQIDVHAPLAERCAHAFPCVSRDDRSQTKSTPHDTQRHPQVDVLLSMPCSSDLVDEYAQISGRA